jgi:hypothetical protein
MVHDLGDTPVDINLSTASIASFELRVEHVVKLVLRASWKATLAPLLPLPPSTKVLKLTRRCYDKSLPTLTVSVPLNVDPLS